MHSLEGRKVFIKFDSGKGGEGEFRVVAVEGGLMKVRPIDPDTGEDPDAFWFPVAHIFTIRELTDPSAPGLFRDDVMEQWSKLGEDEPPE